MNDIKTLLLSGTEGIAYIQRMMLKEVAYVRKITETLPNEKEALRMPGLEFADNLEYFTACLITLRDGGEVEFSPPHLNHLDIDDYRDNY
jgi:hypothetical protein